MKKIIIIIIMLLSVSIYAQNEKPQYYVGTNLLSPISGMNLKVTTVNVLLPLFSNLEYGFTLNAGIYKNYHNWEIRTTLGRSNPYNFIPLIQFVYNYFIFSHLKQKDNGWYIGSCIRIWDYKNITSKTNLYNSTLNFNIGYVFKNHKIITDIRLNQPIIIYSLFIDNNVKTSGFSFNTSPMPQFLPILPFLSINLAYKF